MKDLEVQRKVYSFPAAAERSSKPGKDPLMDFKKVLADSVNETNQQMQRADQSIQEMSLGKIDIHNAMIDIEKASLSFRLLLQIRNRMISAYEEIMRMQF